MKRLLSVLFAAFFLMSGAAFAADSKGEGKAKSEEVKAGAMGDAKTDDKAAAKKKKSSKKAKSKKADAKADEKADAKAK